MSLPEESVNHRPTGGKSGVIMAILLFLAVISVALFTYLNSQGIDITTASLGQLVSGSAEGGGEAEAEVLYDMPFDSREHPVFSAFKDFILKVSKDGIRLLDKKGSEILTETTPLNNPIIRTNGREFLVADTGGQNVYVADEGGILWKDSLDVNIRNADISREGYVTLVTESKRYKNEVRVYGTNGLELFRSIIANDFAVAAKISPSEKQMVIDGINTDGIKAVTGLRFLDMKGGDLGAVSLDSTDGLFPVILYNKAGDLFAIGDRAVISLDGDGKTRWELKFSSVAGACLTAGGKLAVLAGGAGGMRLAVYSAAGKELAACDVDDGAKSVSAGGGLLAVSAQKEAAFYNEKCRPVGKYTSKYDITDVYFFSRKQAAVVMKNQVTVINIG